MCRLRRGSEIINKILFSSLITHYQPNKNSSAAGNVRLPAPASIRPQHFLRKYLESLLCCLTRHEGLSQSDNLTSVWSRLLCLCAPAPLPRTSSFLHSIDLKSEHSLSLYQKLATFILAKHHIQQAEEASSWCHLDNHLDCSHQTRSSCSGRGRSNFRSVLSGVEPSSMSGLIVSSGDWILATHV